MAYQSPTRNPVPASTSAIPDKLYFRIGEVARLCDVPAYVLRFWESEFPQLKPNKGGTGQRLYRQRDVEQALRIKRLLYDEGYTIPGARQLLKGEGRLTEPQLPLVAEATQAALTEQLRRVRKELRELLAIVSRGEGAKRTASPRQSSLQTPPEQRTENLFDFDRSQDATEKGQNG
ncbi:MAG: hypothetical protein NVSMB3_01460 [Acidobacteriaceae bacterium]